MPHMWRAENNFFQVSLLSFYYLGPMDQTPVRLVGKCPFTGPMLPLTIRGDCGSFSSDRSKHFLAW